MVYQIRPIEDSDSAWIVASLIANWEDVNIVSQGQVHDASQLPGFVAVSDEQKIGMITYRLHRDQCEIVTLDSLQERIGVGTALIKAVIDTARDFGVKRIWLVTTNDNTYAIEFYRMRGFTQAAIYHDAITEARKLKPQIPEIGMNGIPIRDEIEFEYLLK